MVQVKSIRTEEKCQTQILLSGVLVPFILNMNVSGAELSVSFYYILLDSSPSQKNQTETNVFFPL